MFLLASSNKKIGQYDLKSGARTLQYDEHLGAINTVTFVDYNRKFVSTSDDKKVFLWEFGLPIVVKHLSEPDMHSIVATAVHPSNKYMVAHQPNNKVSSLTSQPRAANLMQASANYSPSSFSLWLFLVRPYHQRISSFANYISKQILSLSLLHPTFFLW